MPNIVTSVLELLGMLLVVSAVALYLASFSLPLALLAAGIGLIGISAIVTKIGARR